MILTHKRWVRFLPSFPRSSTTSQCVEQHTSSFKQQQRRTTFKERFRFFPTKETRGRHPLEESKSIERFLSSFGLLLVVK